MNKQKIILTCVMAVAVIVGCALLSNGLTQFRKTGYKITVKGKAERKIESDLVQWRFTLSSKGATREEAYRNYEQDMAVLKKFMINHQIPSEVFDGLSPSMSEVEKSYYKDGHYMTEPDGYQVRQTMALGSTEIDHIEEVYGLVASLYAEGLDFDSEPLAYHYTKLDDLKMEMLKAASSDALQRAQIIAEGSDCKVGKLYDSSMGVFQILGENSDEDYSWSGTFNTSSRNKVASITISAVYESL